MDKQLTSFERRLEILFILMRNKKCSMKELAFEYSVSDRTIRRDILFLSRLGKSKFNNLKVYSRDGINYFKKNGNDIRINLIEKFIK